jgi:hypothetical protein
MLHCKPVITVLRPVVALDYRRREAAGLPMRRPIIGVSSVCEIVEAGEWGEQCLRVGAVSKRLRGVFYVCWDRGLAGAATRTR